jgi:soluble lytic murein transglycosylase
MIRFLLFFIPIFIWAIPPLDEVLNYPHSYFRDFYLTQYLKDVKNLKEANRIYNSITYKKRKHLYILSKKFLKYKKIYNCKYPNKKNFKNISYKCILENGFKLNDLKRMKNDDIIDLLNSLPKSDIKLEISAFLNKDYKKLFKNKNAFFDFFLQIPVDIDIPSIYLNNLANDKSFYYFLNFIVRKQNFNLLKRALLNIDYNNLSDKEKFLLALNAINFNYISYAVKILKTIKNKTNKDIFWLYLLTENKKYANKLLNNKRLDFYTLYIYEKFHKKYKIDNVKIFNTSDVIYNIDNPLDVIKFNIDYNTKNSFKFAKKLDNKKMLPLKTLVLDKAFKFQKNYYIMPKYKLDDFNITSKAIFFALARQESRFIPAQISHSYAIGLMQMMPFLIRSFHPKEDISKFFETDTNVKYAKKHILWLSKRLNFSLFIAYAYNGGIGFTKRKVMPFFNFKGIYEPFLSMEMVPYTESREYGKKVLTNYVIYYNKLGGHITLHKLLKHY